MVLTPKVPDFRFALDVREWGSDVNLNILFNVVNTVKPLKTDTLGTSKSVRLIEVSVL